MGLIYLLHQNILQLKQKTAFKGMNEEIWDTKLFMFLNLTSYSLAVSLHTTRFNIQKFYMTLALR